MLAILTFERAGGEADARADSLLPRSDDRVVQDLHPGVLQGEGAWEMRGKGGRVATAAREHGMVCAHKSVGLANPTGQPEEHTRLRPSADCARGSGVVLLRQACRHDARARSCLG